MEARACETTLRIRVDAASLQADNAGSENSIDSLMTDLTRYRIVLTDGHFVAADGFILESDGVVAGSGRVQGRD